MFRKKSYTIMIVPHTDSKPFHFHITLPAIMRISALVCFAGLLLSLFLIDYNNVRLKLFSVAPLQEKLVKEQERLAEQRTRQEEDLKKINGIMTKLKNVEDQFKNITGFESKMKKGGQGGPTYNDRELSGRIKAVEFNAEFENKSEKILEDVKDLEGSLYYQSLKLDEFSGFLENQKGNLGSMPLIWPAKSGHISGKFGYRLSPFNNKRKEFHTGLDISLRPKTPVFATAKGKVIYSGWLPGLGNTIKISHGNGLVTLYGHNSKLLVKSGQIVERGQNISLSGNTGSSTGPHLHYEVQKKGYFENPVNYILNL
ncbi:MAG: M23 family metallopeptidase [bacterium]|nr:M23 family metallopeptidase [bacterium]